FNDRPKHGVVQVPTPGIRHGGDVAGREFAHVQYGAVAAFCPRLEPDADLAAPVFAIVLEQDHTKRGTTDPVAVAGGRDDLGPLKGVRSLLAVVLVFLRFALADLHWPLSLLTNDFDRDYRGRPGLVLEREADGFAVEEAFRRLGQGAPLCLRHLRTARLRE